MIQPMQLLKLDSFIIENDRNNENVKFSLDFEGDTIFAVKVRFFPLEEKFYTAKLERQIFNRIRDLSNDCLFVDENGLFKHGILELKASYLHKKCDIDCFIKPLKFIANDMIDVIIGKKTLD